MTYSYTVEVEPRRFEISHLNGYLTRHMSCVHVEQEITGDDTPVIDSVLKSYTEREFLL